MHVLRPGGWVTLCFHKGDFKAGIGVFDGTILLDGEKLTPNLQPPTNEKKCLSAQLSLSASDDAAATVSVLGVKLDGSFSGGIDKALPHPLSSARTSSRGAPVSVTLARARQLRSIIIIS